MDADVRLLSVLDQVNALETEIETRRKRNGLRDVTAGAAIVAGAYAAGILETIGIEMIAIVVLVTVVPVTWDRFQRRKLEHQRDCLIESLDNSGVR